MTKFETAHPSFPRKAENYRRGTKKKEKVATRAYTCEEGDIVYHNGRAIMVQEVIEQGRESKRERAFIKGCAILGGKPLPRVAVFAGFDWRRAA